MEFDIQIYPLKTRWFAPEKCKFSKSLGYIRKIPLNPPLQKGEAVGMPELIEKLLKNDPPS